MEGLRVTDISIVQAALVLVALLCCLVCLWMVFSFGRRLQTAAYLRDSLVYAASAEEVRNRVRELDERKLVGPLNAQIPPPRGFEYEARTIWLNIPPPSRSLPGSTFIRPSFGTLIPDPSLSDEQNARRRADFERQKQAAEQATEKQRLESEKAHAEEEQRRAPFYQWALEEKQRYAEERNKIEKEANILAKNRVPVGIDVSLLGGGWAFIL